MALKTTEKNTKKTTKTLAKKTTYTKRSVKKRSPSYEEQSLLLATIATCFISLFILISGMNFYNQNTTKTLKVATPSNIIPSIELQGDLWINQNIISDSYDNFKNNSVHELVD